MTSQKKAVIVGATSGIGLEITRLLAKQGYVIGIAGRRQSLLDNIKEEISGVTATACIDINDADAGVRLLDFIHTMGGIDLYFHSSGIGYQNPLLDSDKELSTVETNALGFTRMIDTAFHYFAEQNGGRGHIAAITSIARTKGLGAAPAYSATKRFQSNYLEALSQLSSIHHHHITITDIRPGFVGTDLLKNDKYPLVMDKTKVARHIVNALKRGKVVVTIDWRYRILVFFWRLIPRCIWTHLDIKTRKI